MGRENRAENALTGNQRARHQPGLAGDHLQLGAVLFLHGAERQAMASHLALHQFPQWAPYL